MKWREFEYNKPRPTMQQRLRYEADCNSIEEVDENIDRLIFEQEGDDEWTLTMYSE